MADKRYRLYCETEASEVYVWGDTTPTECPNDAGHTIDSNSIAIVEKRRQTTHTYAHLEFNTGALPYVEVNNGTTWTTIGAFEYSGHDVFEANKMTAIVSRAGATGESRVRLRDVTNGKTIEGKTWAEEEQQVVSDNSFQNVPDDPAILEVQVKQMTEGDSAARVWNFSLEREE